MRDRTAASRTFFSVLASALPNGSDAGVGGAEPEAVEDLVRFFELADPLFVALRLALTSANADDSPVALAIAA